jgi:hypothetical protein
MFSRCLLLQNLDFSFVRYYGRKKNRRGADGVFVNGTNGQAPLHITWMEGVCERNPLHYCVVPIVRSKIVRTGTEGHLTTYERAPGDTHEINCYAVDQNASDDSDDSSGLDEEERYRVAYHSRDKATEATSSPPSPTGIAVGTSVTDEVSSEPRPRRYKHVDNVVFDSLCQFVSGRRGILKSLQFEDCVGLHVELAIKLVGLAGNTLEHYVVEGESKLEAPSFQILAQLLPSRFGEPALTSAHISQSQPQHESSADGRLPPSPMAQVSGEHLCEGEGVEMGVSEVLLPDDWTSDMSAKRDTVFARDVEDSDDDNDDHDLMVQAAEHEPQTMLAQFKTLLSHVMRIYREMDIFKRKFATAFSPLLGGRSWLHRLDALHSLRDWLHDIQAHIVVVTAVEVECGLRPTGFNDVCPVPLFAVLLQDAFVLLEAYTTFKEVLRKSCSTPLHRLTGVGTTHSQHNFGPFSFYQMREEGRYLVLTWDSILQQLHALPERFQPWTIFSEMVDQVVVVRRALALCQSFSHFSNETWSFALGVHTNANPIGSESEDDSTLCAAESSSSSSSPQRKKDGVTFGTLLNCCILDGNLEKALQDTNDQMEKWMILD